MLVAAEHKDGIYTGKYVTGNQAIQSKHNSKYWHILTLVELNAHIKYQNRAKSIITLAEIYSNPTSRDGAYQDNLWK